MTILVDKQIREAIESGLISIDPYDPSLIQSNSLDIRLGNTESRYVAPGYNCVINPADETPRSVSRQVDKILIRPGEFLLAESLEYIKIPKDVVAFVVGKSSTGRLGVDMENAGLVDSGFEGTITFEMFNKTKSHTYSFPVGFPIAQMVFFSCEIVELAYNERATSRYVGQRGATPYRICNNDTAVQGTGNETEGETSTISTIVDFFTAPKRRKPGRRASNSDGAGVQDQ